MTFGWLVGEVVRRVAGRSLGTFFQEEVAAPLGLNFWIGLPAAIEPRVAPMLPPDPPTPGTPVPAIFAAMADPTSLQSLMARNQGGHDVFAPVADSRAAHAAEIPAGGGITNSEAAKTCPRGRR